MCGCGAWVCAPLPCLPFSLRSLLVLPRLFLSRSFFIIWVNRVVEQESMIIVEPAPRPVLSFYGCRVYYFIVFLLRFFAIVLLIFGL